MTRIRFEDLPSTNTPRNAENLNKLNNVIISPTEPTTGEEVWIDNTNKKIYTKNDNGGYEKFYEEFKIESGTWTPKIGAYNETAPTVTYTSQKGFYKKIGNMVYVEFYLRGSITALNGTNHYAQIEGLPYYSATTSLGQQGLNVGVLYGLIYNPSDITFATYNNTIRIQTNFGAGATTLTKTTDTPYFSVGGSGWYMTE